MLRCSKQLALKESSKKDAATLTTPDKSTQGNSAPDNSTPERTISLSAGRQKRGATSPPLTTAETRTKKRREDPVLSSWTEVTKKKRKKKKMGKKVRASGAEQTRKNPVPAQTGKSAPKKRAKADAILLKPVAGKTYADVLSTVRKAVKPESCGVEVKSVRTGEVLVELKKTTAEGRTAFSAALKEAVGTTSGVRELVPRASLEIRDLDTCSTKEEVEEAIGKNLEGYDGVLQVGITRPNGRGQCVAIVTVEEAAAIKLLETARIKIGWVNCRIRRRATVPRCFRCLGYGHLSHDCKGPDRSKLCFRCGAEGHKTKDCEAKPLCFLCPDVEDEPDARRHVAGSGECGTFRRFLSQAKEKR